MKFTDAQRVAIEQDQQRLVVVAGAGSGKTRVLVRRYLRLLQHYHPDQLLAITFTEKAAREMRERVRAELEQAARRSSGMERVLWEERRDAIETARIGTIHSFCATLLRSHPAETGLDPRFMVLDEVEAGQLRLQALDQTLAWFASDPAAETSGLFQEFGVEELHQMVHDLLAGGAETQAACAHLPAIAAQLADQWHIQLVAARNQAAAQLLAEPTFQAVANQLQQLAAVAREADRIGAQVLALAALLHDLQRLPPESLTPTSFTPLNSIQLQGGSKRLWPDAESLAEAKTVLRQLREIYQHHVVLHLSWDEALEQRAAAAVIAVVQLYQRSLTLFTTLKRQREALDFDDLEQMALQLLRQHPMVCARWQQELRAVLVDEFQDTNPEQAELITLLVGEQPQLFVVADGKQSIYGFRGADVTVFEQVRHTLRTSGAEVLLDRSFRAHARMVTLINHSFAHLMPSQTQPYQVAYEPLIADRSASPHPHVLELWLTPERHAGFDADQQRQLEAQALAQRIKDLVEMAAPLIWDETHATWRAPRYGDIALLFQASPVFPAYEKALRQAGVPFLTTAGQGYYQRDEVRDLLHLLQFLDDPRDDFSLVGVLRSPLFAIADQTLLSLSLDRDEGQSYWDQLQLSDDHTISHARTILQQLVTLRGRVTVVELLRTALSLTGYLAVLSGLTDGERRRVNVEKLLQVAREYGTYGLKTMLLYFEQMLAQEAREAEAPLEGDDTVRLMTVHRAKGLEFPMVVLPDLGRGGHRATPTVLPLRQHGIALKLRDGVDWVKPATYQRYQAEQYQRELAERRRLLYVALTRAKDYLILAGPQRQRSGDDWLSWLLQSWGYPWEQGGPAAGQYPICHGALDISVTHLAAPLAVATDSDANQ